MKNAKNIIFGFMLVSILGCVVQASTIVQYDFEKEGGEAVGDPMNATYMDDSSGNNLTSGWIYGGSSASVQYTGGTNLTWAAGNTHAFNMGNAQPLFNTHNTTMEVTLNMDKASSMAVGSTYTIVGRQATGKRFDWSIVVDAGPTYLMTVTLSGSGFNGGRNAVYSAYVNLSNYLTGWHQFAFTLTEGGGAQLIADQSNVLWDGSDPANNYASLYDQSVGSTFISNTFGGINYATVGTNLGCLFAGEMGTFRWSDTILSPSEMLPSRVYASCAEKIAAGFELIGDLNNDCYVDMDDLAIFVSNWLN